MSRMDKNHSEGSLPVSFLQWHITHQCNLRCSHCYQDNYTECVSWEEMLDALEKFQCLLWQTNCAGQINLTGGEPLLHPDFWRLAAEIRRRGIRLGVLTNGTLIGPEEAEKLAKLRPVFVQISLDGLEKRHDRIRGQGSFRKALNGIDCLRRAGVKVLVSFTAQKENVKDFTRLAFVCNAHHVNKLWWDRVVTDTLEMTEKLAVTDRQFVQLCHTGNRLRLLFRLLHTGLVVYNRRALQFAGRLSKKEGGYLCGAGCERLLILLADGSLMACRRLPFVIGRIQDGNLMEIMENSHVMRELNACQHAIPKGCEGCKHLPYCRGGAKCVTYAQTGRLDRRDINCPFRKTPV